MAGSYCLLLTYIVTSRKSSALVGRLQVLHLLVLFRNTIFVVDEGRRNSDLASISSNLVPWQLENSIQTLQRTTTGFRQEEVYPAKTDQCDGGEEVHGTGSGHADKHFRHGLRVAVLVDKVERHGNRSTNGAQTQREDLGVDEILD